MATTEQHLQAARYCVGHDERRPQMHQPFHQEGWNLATDAHVIFGWQGEAVTTGHERAPNALALLLKDENKLDTPFVLHLSALSAALDGLPKVAGKCPACEGKKTCKCQECDHEHDCGLCKGTGFDPHGKADQVDPNALVGLSGLARYAASKLLSVQGVMRCMGAASISIAHGASARPALAVLPGGERLLFMPNAHSEEETKAIIQNGTAEKEPQMTHVNAATQE